MKDWNRFLAHFKDYPEVGMSMDLSQIDWPKDFRRAMQHKLSAALDAMDALEAGSIANPDENRMVGHYWLRASDMAPNAEIKEAIDSTLAEIKTFSSRIHSGEIQGEGGSFRNVIVIGIGGSALGPLFVSKALGNPNADKLKFFILDNTDPDGMDCVFAQIGDALGHTLALVISKSGGTKETRNGMLEVKAAYERSGLSFERHAVAITQNESLLYKTATSGHWLARFPMWDWVGGRTSELSAVGLLPASLQGFDIDNLLYGAREMDKLTRCKDLGGNPAMGMAMAWYASGNGKGDKNLIILPYKDRLELFSRYLQQLIMESIGKERNVNRVVVRQGLSVFGNKGSTDQHSFVQQLRDGRNDFIVTFIEVLEDRSESSTQVEPGLTSGDYLQGFLLGTRLALAENGRESITITIRNVSPYSIGGLIALFERAVGFYASLIDINAYHQPGVEAGKKAAGEIVQLKKQIVDIITRRQGKPISCQVIAEELHAHSQLELIFKICRRLAANSGSRIREILGQTPALSQFKFE